MDGLLLLVIAAVPCVGLWAVVKAKKKFLRVLGALFSSLAVGVAAGIVVGMSRAWSGGTGNLAFVAATAISLLVLVPFSIRRTDEAQK